MHEERHHHHEVSGKKLFITVILNVIITLSQIVGGLLSGSLALMSDAMHNFSDVLSLLIAWGANRLSAKPAGREHTFGFKRAEIIAALFNASLLMGVAVFLIFESFHKLFYPETVNSIYLIVLGLASIALNTLSVMLVAGDAKDNMNIKAAYLHLLTDVMTSVAVVLGGALIYLFDIYWIDPLISMIIAIYLIRASYGLVRESAGVLMQFAPQGLELEKIAQSVESVDGVRNIHHIHIWRLDDHDTYLDAHIDFDRDMPLSIATEKLMEIEGILERDFGISHTTLQQEYSRNDDKSLVSSKSGRDGRKS